MTPVLEEVEKALPDVSAMHYSLGIAWRKVGDTPAARLRGIRLILPAVRAVALGGDGRQVAAEALHRGPLKA